MAVNRKKALAIEALTGIRERGNRLNRAMKTELNNWAFAQLKSFLAYKCRRAGVTLIEVDPAYSSQQCSRCAHTERANRPSQEVFCCCYCCFQAHADVNAAKVLPGLPAQERLNYYLPRFRTVEVNSTFYRWPPDERFVRWCQRLPPGFLMTVKAPRGLTHGACLYSPEKWLQTVRTGLHYLGHHCGILLVQLSPTFAYDYARLAYFLEHVPPEIRVAVEFRHPSWQRQEMFQLLERTGTAYCVMSGAHLPCVLRATASFVYVRLHGPDPDHLYGGSYSEADLTWWKERIQEWSHAGHDVFVYFNNDGAGNAVRNAERLQHLLV